MVILWIVRYMYIHIHYYYLLYLFTIGRMYFLWLIIRLYDCLIYQSTQNMILKNISEFNRLRLMFRLLIGLKLSIRFWLHLLYYSCIWTACFVHWPFGMNKNKSIHLDTGALFCYKLLFYIIVCLFASCSEHDKTFTEHKVCNSYDFFYSAYHGDLIAQFIHGKSKSSFVAVIDH